MNKQASSGRYGKVAVLMGGRSAERDISLQTGAAILAALRRQGVDAHEIDAGETVVRDLVSGGFDRVCSMPCTGAAVKMESCRAHSRP